MSLNSVNWRWLNAWKSLRRIKSTCCLSYSRCARRSTLRPRILKRMLFSAKPNLCERLKSRPINHKPHHWWWDLEDLMVLLSTGIIALLTTSKVSLKERLVCKKEVALDQASGKVSQALIKHHRFQASSNNHQMHSHWLKMEKVLSAPTHCHVTHQA